VSLSSPSASPRGKLRVDLRPGSVTLARRSSFLGTRLQPLLGVPVEQEEPGAEQAEPWRASIDALVNLLGPDRSRSTELEVVMSSHFVRYALVPWSESLIRDAERLAFARVAFRDIYGPVVDRWEVCLDDQPAGQPVLACAMDRDLLAGLRSAAAGVGGRLEAVIPALADCINRHRRALKGRELCLANVEAGRVTFAFRGQLGWRAVRSRRMDGALSELLPTLLKQEASAAGVQEGGILYLCAPHIQDHASLLIPGWKVTLLAEAAPPPAPMMEPALASMES
jgi:hypothetical protein